TLTGEFLANASNNDLAEVNLNIWNSAGQQLAFADLSPVQSSVAAYCPDPSNCAGRNRVFVFQGDSWPGGTLNLPFILPLTRSSGIIMDLWVEAGDFVRDNQGAGVNFSDTATLSFNPPPGVTVTLATGEVFGAGAAVVPEPGSLLLL